MHPTRRNVLAGIGAVATVGLGATQVFGQSTTNIEVQEVNYEGEYVVFANNGSEDVDVSGYTVAFEYSNKDYNQRRELGDGVTIPAGGTLTVATGAEDVSNADETFDYEGSVLRNDGSDVVALLTPEGEVVATSAETPETTPTETTTETTTEEDTETTTESSEDTTTNSDEGTTGGENNGATGGSSEDESSGTTTEDC